MSVWVFVLFQVVPAEEEHLADAAADVKSIPICWRRVIELMNNQFSLLFFHQHTLPFKINRKENNNSFQSEDYVKQIKQCDEITKYGNIHKFKNLNKEARKTKYLA